MQEQLKESVNQIINLSLREDLSKIGDITSNLTIPQDKNINFQISNRQEAILCGVDFALKVFDIISKNNSQIKLQKHHNDGNYLTKNSIIISGSGNARLIFAAERVALNLLQHLCAIASKTNQFVQQLVGETQILDTRKTIPSLRLLQKYAVKIGGGKNHRMGLYDAILIKDNHIAAAGSITNAINMIRDSQPNLAIEIECDNLNQVQESLNNNVDIIMLDNMNLEQIKQAVNLIKDQAKIEVSGNVTIDRVKEISKTGIDYISIGALTHSVQAIDIGLDVK